MKLATYFFIRRTGIPKNYNIAIYDVKILNGMNISALCKNLVRFCPVRPWLTLLKMITFAAIRQESAYHANSNYLRIFWINLLQIYRFDHHMGGDD